MYFERKLKMAIATEAKSNSTEHLLVANPSQWPSLFPDIHLTSIDSNSMHSLMTSSKVIIKEFISTSIAKKAKSELFALERESKFERGYSNHELNKEKYLDFSLKQVNKKDFPG